MSLAPLPSPSDRSAGAARGRLLLAAALAALAGGCANVGYYLHSVAGQLGIWGRERPIEEVLADEATPEALRARLEGVIALREFAARELALPAARSFRHYADLERPFAVWNVYAAPEFSVEPLRWCFLFAGCVSYRGYFSEQRARRFAASLAERGYDVYVAGVAAYSTLGYFSDPVLSTFVHFPPVEIARLVFHELAHQVLYVPDDTTFNESFAVAVETEGVRRWLARSGDAAALVEFERGERLRAELARLVERYRGRFDALYRSGLEEREMRARKRALFAELEEDYRRLARGAGAPAAGRAPLLGEPNNARLAALALYRGYVPAFAALLARSGGDLERFYREARALAQLPAAERAARLRALAP